MITQDRDKSALGPLVSVLIPTFNRKRFLPAALAGALHQSYRNIEVIVVRDGGEKVRDVIDFFNDPRIMFIDRQQNRGKAFSLNEGLVRSRGAYVAYLDDDDVYYPNHISTLVDTLENKTDCDLAYTDLYRTYCRLEPDGTRVVLSKVLEVSRDFDRFLMLYFSHVLHVSLMHRRHLLDKTGPYNEDLQVLIDWDFTRKACFFTGFHHIPTVTGEYYSPIGDCDRLSVSKRKDKKQYLKDALSIRTVRPPKPWPKMKDVSILFCLDCLDKLVADSLLALWQHTFYPYRVYLPLSKQDLARLNSDMPNLVVVPIETPSSHAQQIDAALQQCDGDVVVVLPKGFPIDQFWLEDPLHALLNCPASSRSIAIEMESSTDKLWAAVLNTDDLRRARRDFPDLSIRDSLNAAGIVVRRPLPDEIPCRLDQSLAQARLAEKQGDWTLAARIFQYVADHDGNELWMQSLAARDLFEAAEFDQADELCHQINQQRPTVDTLLLEAKIKRQKSDFDSAICLLESARQTLEGTQLSWT